MGDGKCIDKPRRGAAYLALAELDLERQLHVEVSCGDEHPNPDRPLGGPRQPRAPHADLDPPRPPLDREIELGPGGTRPYDPLEVGGELYAIAVRRHDHIAWFEFARRGRSLHHVADHGPRSRYRDIHPGGVRRGTRGDDLALPEDLTLLLEVLPIVDSARNNVRCRNHLIVGEEHRPRRAERVRLFEPHRRQKVFTVHGGGVDPSYGDVVGDVEGEPRLQHDDRRMVQITRCSEDERPNDYPYGDPRRAGAPGLWWAPDALELYRPHGVRQRDDPNEPPVVHHRGSFGILLQSRDRLQHLGIGRKGLEVFDRHHHLGHVFVSPILEGNTPGAPEPDHPHEPFSLDYRVRRMGAGADRGLEEVHHTGTWIDDVGIGGHELPNAPSGEELLHSRVRRFTLCCLDDEPSEKDEPQPAGATAAGQEVQEPDAREQGPEGHAGSHRRFGCRNEVALAPPQPRTKDPSAVERQGRYDIEGDDDRVDTRQVIGDRDDHLRRRGCVCEPARREKNSHQY